MRADVCNDKERSLSMPELVELADLLRGIYEQRIRHLAFCSWKQQFSTHEQARRACRRDRRLSIYRCAYCGAWHLGSTRFVKGDIDWLMKR